MSPDRTPTSVILSTALAATAASVAYLSTLLPGVGHAGDVTKFQFVGHVLGTPHAPGYPLYTLLTSAFTHAVPFGSVAWRANLLSAVFAVLAVVMLAAVLRRLGCGPWLAAATALATGLLPAVWSQAVIAEVYTLHLLFVTTTLWLLLRWQATRRRRDLVAALAVFCLAFAHHLTIVTLAPAVVMFVLMVDRDVARPRSLATLLPVPLLGIVPYGYLFWRTAQSTTSYLEVQTPDLATWLWYLRGAQFRERIFAFDLVETLTERAPLLAGFALKQLAPAQHALDQHVPGLVSAWRVVLATLLLAALVIGVVALRDTARHVLLAGVFLGNTIYALGYDIPDLGAYLIPSYVVLMIYASLGLARVIRRAPARTRTPARLAFALLPLSLFILHRPATDRSADHAASDRARTVLETIDGNASVGPRIVIAADYLGYETLQYVRQIGLAADGPRRDLFIMTPLLPENITADIQVFIDRHRPPELVRNQLLDAHTPSTVIRYLEGERSLRSFEERSTLPAALPVYVLGDAQAEWLANAGAETLALGPGIVRVSPAGVSRAR